MTEQRDIAGFICEWRGERRSVAIICFPNGIALYPADLVELDAGLAKAAMTR